MNRSPQTRERRRNIADGALGLTRINVAVYANLRSVSEPSPYTVLDALRRYAEARDWTVRPGAILCDVGPADTPVRNAGSGRAWRSSSRTGRYPASWSLPSPTWLPARLRRPAGGTGRSNTASSSWSCRTP